MIAGPEGPGRIAQLLAWYRSMGVTTALADAPIDWRARGNVAPGAGYIAPSARERAPPIPARAPTAGLADSRPPQSPSPRSSATSHVQPQPRPLPSVSPQPVRVFGAMAPTAQRMPAAGSAPSAARSLAELAAELRAFEGCGLKGTAKNLCLFRGAETARLMIIGDAPGRDEDLAGVPFVGPTGRLLELMLAAIGLGETDVHMTNLVYWRPPGDQQPTPQQIAACAPFLRRQIELVAPDVVLSLGGIVATHLLAINEPIMKIRGTWRTLDSAGRSLAVLPTLSPDYVLKTPASKRRVWQDLLTLKAALTKSA